VTLLAAVFQVLLSAGFSLAGAIAIVLLVRRALRVREGRLALALAALPLAKAGYEIARGVPHGAFFWQAVGGARQELGSFRFGFGVSRLGPVIDISLGALWRGVSYPQSAADVLSAGLVRGFGPAGPRLAAAALLLVTALLVARRLWRAPRARDLGPTRVVDVCRLPLRRVEIVACASWQGVPFARGVVRPQVCFAEGMYDALSAEERGAVIAHELGHLRGLHLALVAPAELASRLFWFVPGVRWLAREIATQCEICADESAVREGVDPELLAATLVRVAELAGASAARPALAFFGKKSVLARRVNRLLGAPEASRPALVALRVVGVLVAAAAVLRATTFGNP
jgi:Zn-dependent protease with chaperone function